MTIFEFVPAAQVKGTRVTFCFLAMSGPNRRSRNQESTARGSNDPPNQSQADQAFRSEDSEYDGPQTENTACKSREFPEDATFVHKKTITNSVSHFVKNANGIKIRKWLGS